MSDSPNNRTILVTGATGFLGGRLVERLSELGTYSIYATGRNVQKGAVLQKMDRVTFIPADLTDKVLVDQLCKHIDIVVHTAALSTVWGEYEEFYEANVLATKHIVEACQKQQVKRLVHISTPSLYPQGYDDDIINIKESFIPKTFISNYAKTKYEAEHFVNAAAKEGLETIILRPRAIYGRGDYTIMPRVLRAYHAGRLKIIGDGENINDLTHVANVVDAILLSMHANEKALGHTFNISDGNPVKMWDVIAMVLQKLNLPWKAKKVPYKLVDKIAWGMEKWAKLTKSKKEPVLTRASVSVVSHSVTLNIDKARDLLDYTPKHKLEDGIQEFVDWWKMQ